MIFNNVIAKIEAMLFAAADPVEASKLAEILDIDTEEAEKMLAHLSAQYEENNSGICLVQMNHKYQLCSRKEYSNEVRRLLEIRRNAPLSQAAFEVLAIVAYNQPVTRSFVEQVRGVDSSGSVTGLVEKGLIEEKGRLDLPGRPLVYGTTDQFLRCFGLSSLDELPELPEHLDQGNLGQIEGQTSFKELLNQDELPDEIEAELEEEQDE